MDPRPTALGLTLCDRIIVDQLTGQPSLICIFTGLQVDRFPSPPTRFAAYAVLTGGVGRGIITLRALRSTTGEQVYRQRGRISFLDRTDVVSAPFRIDGIVFPGPGFYLFQVLIDDELILGAERRIRVYRRRNVP
jgi:hypothetical protein